jgi:hypothetical protein
VPAEWGRGPSRPNRFRVSYIRSDGSSERMPRSIWTHSEGAVKHPVRDFGMASEKGPPSGIAADCFKKHHNRCDHKNGGRGRLLEDASVKRRGALLALSTLTVLSSIWSSAAAGGSPIAKPKQELIAKLPKASQLGAGWSVLSLSTNLPLYTPDATFSAGCSKPQFTADQVVAAYEGGPPTGTLGVTLVLTNRASYWFSRYKQAYDSGCLSFKEGSQTSHAIPVPSLASRNGVGAEYRLSSKDVGLCNYITWKGHVLVFFAFHGFGSSLEASQLISRAASAFQHAAAS